MLELPLEKLIFSSLKEENNPFNGAQREVGELKTIFQSKARNFSQTNAEINEHSALLVASRQTKCESATADFLLT